MKRAPNLVALLAILTLAAGCSRKTENVSNRQEIAIPSESDVTIRIEGDDRMRYSPVEFTVAAGEEVTIVFENVGKMPKAAMGHNWVLLKAETDPREFAMAGATHSGTEFIAPATVGDVLAATPILGPGETASVTFTAPEKPGDYPFVCTFPGHIAAGMKGVMKVK